MFYLASLLMLVTLCCLVTVVGRRIVELLPIRTQVYGRFYFAPVLGLAALVLAATLYGWFLAFTFQRVFLITLALAAVCVYFERRRGELARNCAGLSIFSVFGSLLIFFPLARFDTYNPNNDTFTYLVHGQWLQQHPFIEPAVSSGFYPALSQVVLYQFNGHRMGASFTLAWIQALFNLDWSYYAYPAAVALAFVCGAFAAAGAVRLIVPGNYPGRTVIPVVIAAASGSLYTGFAYGASNGFLPMTYGLSFATAGVVLFAALLADHRSGRLLDLALRGFPVALLFAAMIYAYNELIGPVGLGIAVFVALFALTGVQSAIRVLTSALIVGLEIAIMVNYEIVRIIINFLFMVRVARGSPIGYPIPWNPVEFLGSAFGLKSAIDQSWVFRSSSLTVLLLLVVVGIAIVAAVRVIGSRSATPLYAVLSVLGVFLAGFVYFRYVARGPTPGEIGISFLQFKLANYASLFCLIWVGVGLAYFARRLGPNSVSLSGIGVLAVGITAATYGNYRQSYGLTHHFIEETGFPTSSFSRLVALRQTVSGISPNDVIYLDLEGPRHKLRQIVSYILHDRKLGGRYEDDTYLGTIPSHERAIPLQLATWIIGFARPADLQKPTRPMVGNLILSPRPTALAALAGIEGGYARETDGVNSWHWTSQSIRFNYRITGAVAQIRFSFEHLRAVAGTLTIDVRSGPDGAFKLDRQLTIAPGEGWAKYESPEIPIRGPNLTVEIRSDAKPRQLGSDPRSLSFLTKNFDLVTVEK